ncbi:MAG: hypothetical protein ACREUI_00340 [Burkholderiales bacterium]
MKEVYVNKRLVKLPDKCWKDGAEAKIHKIDAEIVFSTGMVREQQVLKLFREPDDPRYQHDQNARNAAEKRLKYHRLYAKLENFPENLPQRVIVPQEIARDSNGTIVGYSMQFMAKAELFKEYVHNRDFRDGLGRNHSDIVNNIILPVFRDLHHTISELHKKDVIIGDFNDANVLIEEDRAYIIDADSFQFGIYPCELYKPEFLDPALMNQRSEGIVKLYGKKYTADSDWYVYNIMLMQNLLFVGPYAGKVISHNKKITEKIRREQHLNIFHPDVRYSNKDNFHHKILPDDLREYFFKVFGEDKRGNFPACLLDMCWKKCTSCGVEHARERCPNCYRTTTQTVTSGSAQAGVPVSPTSLPSAKWPLQSRHIGSTVSQRVTSQSSRQARAQRPALRATDNLKGFIKRHKIGIAAAAIFGYVITMSPFEDRITQLERALQERTGVFDWNAHNELRHLHITNNPPHLRKSMEHSNVILQHSYMDGYILNILSEWQIDKNTSAARANLRRSARHFPDLRFIAAACFLKIGDLYVFEGNINEAKFSYLKVAEDKSSDMTRYRVLAEERL